MAHFGVKANIATYFASLKLNAGISPSVNAIHLSEIVGQDYLAPFGYNLPGVKSKLLLNELILK